MLYFLFKGLIIGFAIAAPVGPIGILCIQRSLTEGYKSGFVIGCGAATADGIYGCVAGLGLTYISGFLLHQQFWIRLIGGVFLLYLGIKTILTKPPVSTAIISPKNNLWRAYCTTLFLTLTNPMTILSFLAIFAGVGIGSLHGDYLQTMIFIAGVVAGSLLWWMILCSGVTWIRTKINSSFLQWINRCSGGLLILFALIANL